MSKAIVLNEKFEKKDDLAIPAKFDDIHTHNLYIYVKSYLAALRANNAQTKNRSAVSGGGKKPWAQKGGGRARAGSKRSPLFVGGGVAHGPSNDKNYNQKVNKKQKKLALQFAINEKAKNNALYVVDDISVQSGKTKDAKAIISKLNLRDVLVVKDLVDENTFLSFRNLDNSYLIESNELNAYLASTFHNIIIEKNVLENLIKEG
ncbi:MAG: LSU ribosomal protein L4p (L1e) [uncultured Campylobacterales bacterium]|uniref:Large ribosomal subunit protein uL4 n=1 Tax=uncultured Campylobacterales bacterium TaxID=352960 RepID=A0A6S6SIN5_9BACT|nr:MAG: LSU ribosomal protein L4p (L1e) [uncultured Campylobacterales bacterium]